MEAMLDPFVPYALSLTSDLSVVLFVQAFQPGCKVHDIAERRVVHLFGRAEIADHRLAEMNFKPGMEGLQSFRLELTIDRLIGGLRLQCCTAGAFAMIGLPGSARSRTPSRRPR